MFSALMTLTTPDNTGASRVAFEYAKAVIRQGGSVMLAHGREPDVDDGRDSLLKKMRDAGIKLKSEPRLELPWESSLVRDLTKVAEEESIDCVIGNNQRDRSVAINVANRASLPAIVCGHNQHVFRGRWPLPMIKKRYYRNAVRRANLVICSSKQVENEFVDWFDVDKERCVLMPHGIQPTNEQAFSQEQIEQLRSSFTAGPSDLLLQRRSHRPTKRPGHPASSTQTASDRSVLQAGSSRRRFGGLQRSTESSLRNGTKKAGQRTA